MVNLTTTSPHRDFQQDLGEFAYQLESMAKSLENDHRRVAPQSRAFGYGVKNETPDSYSLFSGFHLALSQLCLIVNMIGELEEIASCEEELEESEQYHTYGELFALKEMYTRLKMNIHVLEQRRLEATDAGINPRHFMSLILKGEGVPVVPEPNGFGPITTGQLNAQVIAAGSIPISALAPSVPPLLP